MSSELFAADFAICAFSKYSLKVNSDHDRKFYTCTLKKIALTSASIPQVLDFPLEYMKELIQCMRDLFDIINKNKTLIIEKNLSPTAQIDFFSIQLDMDEERIIQASLSVPPCGHLMMIGLRESIFGGLSEPNCIMIINDVVDVLSLAIDEAKNTFNKLDENLKTKRKFKSGVFIKRTAMFEEMLQKISKETGRSFK